MHSGKNYSFKEVVILTRRDLLFLFILSLIPTTLYVEFDWKWLSIPWLPIALLGTAVAFAIGFRNNASYDRLWEARKAWGAIVNYSRAWGIMVKDYSQSGKGSNIQNLKVEKEILANRHFAWLTALRFYLREQRVWEAIYKKYNAEYKNKWFSVQEQEEKLESVLSKYLQDEELQRVLKSSNKATQIIALQSEHLKRLHAEGIIDDFRHMEMEKILVEFLNQQGVSERIKNFPYPRQYATLNMYFIRIFVVLVPFGMIQEFEKLGECMIWLAIPFSTLSCWIFTTMERIGESSESPFEGSANDVPISAISRNIEIDLKEMLQMENIPEPIKPENNILV